MRQKEFYKNSYAQDQAFDSLPKFNKIISLIEKERPRVLLDLGCGDGAFVALIREKTKVSEVFGVDISEEAARKAKERGIEAIPLNIDEQDLPFTDNSFDIVFCGELIEHLFDPDHLLQEIRRVLKPGGLCILTTPNLSSWVNRIALLLGYQPFFTEVSTKFGVGHLFPFWLNAGHMRLFTYRAIRDLVKIYDFQVEKIYGVGINTKLGLGKKLFLIASLLNKIFQPFPSLASDLILVIRKK